MSLTLLKIKGWDSSVESNMKNQITIIGSRGSSHYWGWCKLGE